MVKQRAVLSRNTHVAGRPLPLSRQDVLALYHTADMSPLHSTQGKQVYFADPFLHSDAAALSANSPLAAVPDAVHAPLLSNRALHTQPQRSVRTF